MKKSYVFIGLIIILILMFVGSYNSLVRLDESVDNEWAQVENQLKRRADLIPNLVNTVKGYAEHEKEVLVGVTEARNKIMEATTPEEYAKANTELDNALSQVNMVVERYPELKANENFSELQYELAGTENRLAVARMDYNKIVKKYNSKVRRFPTNIVANMFGFDKHEYFKIDEKDVELPNVEF